MQYVERSPAACTSSATLLAGLLAESFVERIADLLERVQGESRHGVAHHLRPRATDKAEQRDPQAMIRKIGANGDLVSKAREILVSFQRPLMHRAAGNQRHVVAGPARLPQVRGCATCSRCRTTPGSSPTRSSSSLRYGCSG